MVVSDLDHMLMDVTEIHPPQCDLAIILHIYHVDPGNQNSDFYIQTSSKKGTKMRVLI